MAGGSKTSPRRATTAAADRLLLAGFGLFAFVSAASFLGRLADIFELVSNFRVQLTILAFALALAFAARRMRAAAAVATLLLVAHAVPLWPYATARPPAVAGEGTRLVLMAANLHVAQADMGRFEAQLELVRPDVVFLVDLPRDIRRRMAAWKERYPWQVYGPRSRRFQAILLMSRVPIVESRLEFDEGPWVEPIIEARVCPDARAAGACLTLVGVHPANPLKSRVRRDGHLARAVGHADGVDDGRAVLLGDLNVTPWSPSWHDIVGPSRLRDAALGFPLRATWVSRFAPFGLAIDHVLVGPAVAVADFRVGADFGSGHLPVIAEILLPPTPAHSAGAALRNTSRAAP